MLINLSLYRKRDKKLVFPQRFVVKLVHDVIKSGIFNYCEKMAVPKKKTSKGKRNQRHATWKGKAAVAAEKALSIGKSVLTGRAQGFVYPMNENSEEETD
jgi:large subunit ribosomal protein L32